MITTQIYFTGQSEIELYHSGNLDNREYIFRF